MLRSSLLCSRFAGAQHAILNRFASTRAIPMNEPFPGISASKPVDAKQEEAKVTQLSNGVKVVSKETHSPAATIGVYVDAGSRHEAHFGTTHFLRRMAFQSTRSRTAFRITREAEQIGAQLSATSSREHIAYNVDTIRSNLPFAVDLLSDAVRNPAFHHWELSDQVFPVELDILESQAEPQSLVIDRVHEAAFRHALAQPVICPPSQIHHIDSKTLADFHSKYFTPSRTSIVGVGVSHAELVNLAQHAFGDFKANAGTAAAKSAAKYYGGGEVRLNAESHFVHAALAFEGVSVNSPDYFASLVLQQALGSGVRVQYGGSGGRFATSLSSANISGGVAVSSIAASYSDAGLLGVYTVSSAENSGKALSASVKAIKSVASERLTEDELKRAKALAKANIAHGLESRSAEAENLGRQSLLFNKIVPLSKLFESIDAVTRDSVTELAKKATKSKPSLAIYGNLQHAPWLDELSH